MARGTILVAARGVAAAHDGIAPRPVGRGICCPLVARRTNHGVTVIGLPGIVVEDAQNHITVHQCM